MLCREYYLQLLKDSGHAVSPWCAIAVYVLTEGQTCQIYNWVLTWIFSNVFIDSLIYKGWISLKLTRLSKPFLKILAAVNNNQTI